MSSGHTRSTQEATSLHGYMRRLHCSAGCAVRCQQSRSRFACAVIAVVNAVRTKWLTLITLLFFTFPASGANDLATEKNTLERIKHGCLTLTASCVHYLHRHRPMSARRSPRCRLVQTNLTILSMFAANSLLVCAVVHALRLAVNTCVDSISNDLHSKVIVGHMCVWSHHISMER